MVLFFHSCFMSSASNFCVERVSGEKGRKRKKEEGKKRGRRVESICDASLQVIIGHGSTGHVSSPLYGTWLDRPCLLPALWDMARQAMSPPAFIGHGSAGHVSSRVY